MERWRPFDFTSDDESATPEAPAGARRPWRPWRRIPPMGGPRLAASYAVAAAAALLGVPLGVALAGWLYDSGRLCTRADDMGCAVLTGFGISGVAGVLVLVVGAVAAALGWIWLLLFLGLFSAVFQFANFDVASPWWLAALGIPLVASVLTDPVAGRFRRRRLLVAGALGGVLLAWFAVSIARAFVG